MTMRRVYRNCKRWTVALVLLCGCNITYFPEQTCGPGRVIVDGRCFDADAAMPCSETCQGSTPFCDLGTGQCVACVDDSACEEDAPQCVGGICAACTGDEACARFSERPQCVLGQCGACTPNPALSEETKDCPGGSCNADPASEDYLTCSDTVLGSVGKCETCVSDHQCIAGHRCVAMTFAGASRVSGYCLEEKAVDCLKPYGIEISTRDSFSGQKDTIYCGINEMLATCEAVTKAGDQCVAAGQIPIPAKCPEGARCEKLGPADSDWKCTYECESTSECDLDPAVDTCSGVAPDRFCGP